MLPTPQVTDPSTSSSSPTSSSTSAPGRVQNEVVGHRGRKHRPLYRCRRLLTKADERLDDKGPRETTRSLARRRSKGEVTAAWHAKEAIRGIYDHTSEKLAREWIDRLIIDLADQDNPVEVRSLSRTLKKWKEHIVAWHRSKSTTNGPAEALDNLVKRVKRAAFGFWSFRNYRVRSLLYAGKPLGPTGRHHTPLKSEMPAIRRTSSRRMDRNRVAYPALRSPGRRPPDA